MSPNGDAKIGSLPCTPIHAQDSRACEYCLEVNRLNNSTPRTVPEPISA